MTATEPTQPQPHAARRAMGFDSLPRIAGATGFEATRRAEPGRDPCVPEIKQRHQSLRKPHPCAHSIDEIIRGGSGGSRRGVGIHGQEVAFHCCFARAKVLSSAIATEPFSTSRLALLRAITTRSTFPGSDSRSCRNQSRTRLLMRLRTTAFPTRRLALIPTRLRSPQAFGVMILTNSALAARRPSREIR